MLFWTVTVALVAVVALLFVLALIRQRGGAKTPRGLDNPAPACLCRRSQRPRPRPRSPGRSGGRLGGGGGGGASRTPKTVPGYPSLQRAEQQAL